MGYTSLSILGRSEWNHFHSIIRTEVLGLKNRSAPRGRGEDLRGEENEAETEVFPRKWVL